MNKSGCYLSLAAVLINILCMPVNAETGGELFDNGDFESSSSGAWIASRKLTGIVQTQYGRTLKMVKPFNSKEYPCIFKIFELNPNKMYELSFDFQPDNIQFGGEVRIEFKKYKQKAVIKSFDACNTTWNNYKLEFKPIDSTTQIMIRLWPGEKPGSTMLLDNISLREAGNLLPSWTQRNINPHYQQSNGFYAYKVKSGKALINIGHNAFMLNATSAAETEFTIQTYAIKPLMEYKLHFKFNMEQEDKMNILVCFLDVDKKQIGKPVNISVGKNVVSGKFKTPASVVWCKTIIDLRNNKGNKFMMTAPVLMQTEKQDM